MLRTESPDFTLIFVDMLGSAALTEKYPDHLIYSGPDEHGIEGASSSESFNTFNRFHRILEQHVLDHSGITPQRAMLFSDCAFLAFENSLLAGLTATTLMRACILEKVRVRMGIGKGKFHPIKFSTDVTDGRIVNCSRFIGTAVVRAARAEHCGGKGLRIFVHPLVEPDLNLIQGRIKVLPLAAPYLTAKWELDFLHESKPASHKPSAGELDHRLFKAVLEMKEESANEEQIHYNSTVEAINQMCRANGRPVCPNQK